jgi:hypothetical protein
MFTISDYKKYFGIFPRYIEMVTMKKGMEYSIEITDIHKFRKFSQLIEMPKLEILLWGVGDIMLISDEQLNHKNLKKFIRSNKLRTL